MLKQTYMTKTTTLIIAIAIVAAGAAFLRRSVGHASIKPAYSDVTCGDEYNALVLRAKQSLQKGDRAGAISSLLAAQTQLRHCEELEERNAAQPHSVALNSLQLLASAEVD